MLEQQNNHLLSHLSPGTLHPSLSHQPFKKWFHMKRTRKKPIIPSSFSLQHSTHQRVLDLQPAPRPGKVTAGAFTSFIPHHMNHMTASLSAAGGTHLAAPVDTHSTGKTVNTLPQTVHSKQRLKEQTSFKNLLCGFI